MNALKKLNLKYEGELHDIRLINFFVDLDEVLPLVPARLRVRRFGKKALISMVDVKLKKMSTDVLPFFRFNYRHIAFRLLVEDSKFNKGESKGIYFLRSFANKPWIALGGKILTNYNLSLARIREKLDRTEVIQGKNKIIYQRDDKTPKENKALDGLKSTIGTIDRAYSVDGDILLMTQILREKWPIQPVECAFFSTTFFKTAQFVGAFKVNEVIPYTWLPPIKIFGETSKTIGTRGILKPDFI